MIDRRRFLVGSAALAGLGLLGLVSLSSARATQPYQVYLPTVRRDYLRRPLPSPSPWPMEGRDAMHRGQADVAGPSQPKVAWSCPYVPVDGISYIFPAETPVVSGDGSIYVATVAGLYSLTLSGMQNWRYKPFGRLDHPPAIGSDGVVYVNSTAIQALNPDGNIIWEYEPPGSSVNFSGPIIIGPDDTLYAGRPDGNLHVLGSDGSVKWQRPVPWGWSGSSLAVDGAGTIYVPGDDGLYALNPDGTPRWTYSTGYALQSIPTVAPDRTIYFSSYQGWAVYAIDPNGQLKWRWSAGRGLSSGVAIGPDGTIYVAATDRYLYALNPDGSLKWTAETFNVGASNDAIPVVGADGTIYVNAYHRIFAFDPAGTRKWDIYCNAASRSLAVGSDGTLFVGGYSSTLATAVGQA